jgi:hypothetical protein
LRSANPRFLGRRFARAASLARHRHFRYTLALVPHTRPRARSSAGEHYVDIVGVTGSIPVAPTRLFNNLTAGCYSARTIWKHIVSNDIRKCTGGDTEKCTTFVAVGSRFERRREAATSRSR